MGRLTRLPASVCAAFGTHAALADVFHDYENLGAPRRVGPWAESTCRRLS
jgi:hypothetical protein